MSAPPSSADTTEVKRKREPDAPAVSEDADKRQRVGDEGGVDNASSVPPAAVPGQKEGDWMCPKCNANVFASKTCCFLCNTPNPDGSAAAPLAAAAPFSAAAPIAAAHGDVRPGDWTCPSCNSNVFASKMVSAKLLHLK